MTKNITTEIKPNGKTAMENTTKRPPSTGESLKILVIWKAETSRTKAKPVVQSDFNVQLGRKLYDDYAKQSVEIDEVSCLRIEYCRRAPCFPDHTTEAKYGQVAPFLRAFVDPKN